MAPRPAPRGRREEVDKHSYDGDDGDACCGVGNCLATLISLPVIIAASIIVPIFAIAFIIVGAIYINDCAIEPLVPIWLIVQGVIMLFGIGTGGMAKRMLKSSSSSSSSFIFRIIGFVLSVITVTWFVAGNVWVYQAWSQNPDYAHYWYENGCNMSVYRLAFWGIIVLDVLFGVSLIVAVVAFLLRGCRGR